MAQVLLAIGGTIFIMLGISHGVLTLLDVTKPRNRVVLNVATL